MDSEYKQRVSLYLDKQTVNNSAESYDEFCQETLDKLVDR